MKTQFANELAQAFDVSALDQIKAEAYKRAEWCSNEARLTYRNKKDLKEYRDLMSDADKFFMVAAHIENLLND